MAIVREKDCGNNSTRYKNQLGILSRVTACSSFEEGTLSIVQYTPILTAANLLYYQQDLKWYLYL